MKAQRRKTVIPKVYFSSKSDPDYRRAGRDYYLSHVVLGYPKVEPAYGIIGDHFLKQLDYFKKIENGWTISSDGSRMFSTEADCHVIDAIKEYGVDAIRLPPDAEADIRSNKPESQFLGVTDLLGIAVCKVIRYWRDQAVIGNRAAKKRGTECLKNVARSLIPETRGRRGILGIGPGVVQAVYYLILFDLYQIRQYILSSSAPRNASLAVKKASHNFEWPIDTLREFLHIDENDQPKLGGRIRVQEHARIFTARRLGITEQTVSNNLSVRD